MENTNEAAPVVAATKVVAGLAKAGAKAAAKKTVVGKFKRPNIKSYKDPKTGQVDMDKYRQDQAKYKKIKQDQKNRPDMSNTNPDGVDNKRTARGERKLKAIDKVKDKKKENIKKGLQTTGDVANKAGEYGKKSVSAATKGFGTTSFAKEGITFKDYLNKL